MPRRLTWCEVSIGALKGNLSEFRRLVGPDCGLAPTVKANAYGHGLVIAAAAFVEAGADALCVNDAWEAGLLRDAGLDSPIHILGRVLPEQAGEVVELDASVVAYDLELARALHAAATLRRRRVSVHLKVETGTNRQGLGLRGALELARAIRDLPGVELLGLAMHFSDIEDTTDHAFAEQQIAQFRGIAEALRAEGFALPVLNIANTAATILWPQTHLDLVRIGIGAFGMWPSKETFVSAAMIHRERLALRPALTWKTMVAQVKELAAGEFVGYGRTFRTTHPTRLAVLPVGYYDGYDRRLSNAAHVLLHGQRAPVRGRVCMNMTLADVTDIPEVRPGDEVVLLGTDGDEAVSAEQMAAWIGTINYEVTTRIAESVPRLAVS
jgi:alanine racemase